MPPQEHIPIVRDGDFIQSDIHCIYGSESLYAEIVTKLRKILELKLDFFLALPACSADKHTEHLKLKGDGAEHDGSCMKRRSALRVSKTSACERFYLKDFRILAIERAD
ncbi:hypothetical protein AVEN_144834-1 [Araneus ventricosus]|uniref:Uncharacterized protein n=1 Tax=Araneus ventricosus TaxID=182803 RepID=A0A4Y2X8G9_ARAVE|nr:hypothetical protein AVEN_144834-1 [Araneus ventricosus]